MAGPGVGAASLLQMSVPPSGTSPRRVSVPVLVRDGKPRHQQVSQQTAPASANYYSVSSAAGYGDRQSAAFEVTPSSGAYFPSYGGSTGLHLSHSATAAAAAFHQTPSANGMITNVSGAAVSTTLPTAINSLNCAETVTVSRDPNATGRYGQSRWW